MFYDFEWYSVIWIEFIIIYLFIICTIAKLFKRCILCYNNNSFEEIIMFCSF